MLVRDVGRDFEIPDDDKGEECSWAEASPEQRHVCLRVRGWTSEMGLRQQHKGVVMVFCGVEGRLSLSRFMLVIFEGLISRIESRSVLEYVGGASVTGEMGSYCTRPCFRSFSWDEVVVALAAVTPDKRDLWPSVKDGSQVM